MLDSILFYHHVERCDFDVRIACVASAMQHIFLGEEQGEWIIVEQEKKRIGIELLALWYLHLAAWRGSCCGNSWSVAGDGG